METLYSEPSSVEKSGLVWPAFQNIHWQEIAICSVQDCVNSRETAFQTNPALYFWNWAAKAEASGEELFRRVSSTTQKKECSVHLTFFYIILVWYVSENML